MLQSIQYIGSGPPTYVYSKNAVGTSGEFYHVFAAETRGYDERQERRRERSAEKHRKNAENYLKKIKAAGFDAIIVVRD